MKSQLVFIRADSSALIGAGHVMRCRALAEALKANGAQIAFLSRENGLVQPQGFPVIPLPPVASQAEDAERCADAIKSSSAKCDWLIVDHYEIDHQWETAMRQVAPRILVIDDLANRRHDCDLLLDQTYVSSPAERYRGL